MHVSMHNREGKYWYFTTQLLSQTNRILQCTNEEILNTLRIIGNFVESSLRLLQLPHNYCQLKLLLISKKYMMLIIANIFNYYNNCLFLMYTCTLEG